MDITVLGLSGLGLAIIDVFFQKLSKSIQSFLVSIPQNLRPLIKPIWKKFEELLLFFGCISQIILFLAIPSLISGYTNHYEHVITWWENPTNIILGVLLGMVIFIYSIQSVFSALNLMTNNRPLAGIGLVLAFIDVFI